MVRLLVCDDAPQFTLVTEELALCWVHEGRHYKKLMPSIPYHQALLEAFVQRFWTYYDQLLAYREQPTPEEADATGLRSSRRCSRPSRATRRWTSGLPRRAPSRAAC